MVGFGLDRSGGLPIRRVRYIPAMRKQRLAILGATLVFAGVGVPAALADNPNDTQYGNVAGQEQSSPPKGPTGTLQSTQPSGTLPFTGFDVAAAFAAGALAIGGGVGLRKLGQKRNQQV